MTARIHLTSGQSSLRAAAVAAALFLGASLTPIAPTLRAQEVSPIPSPEEQRVLIERIVVRGNVRLDAAAIVTESGLKAGERVGPADIQRAIRRLWASGQYSDVAVDVEGEGAAPAGASLVIRVSEQPFVRSIDFQGLKSVSAGAVRDTVGLVANGPLRPAKVAEAKSLIRKLLAGKGWQPRSIEHRLEPIADRPGENRLIFVVDEGQRVAIAEIAFEGNQAFSESELRKVLGTKPEGFLWYRKGTYDEEKLRTDLREKLPAFYGENGHIDFRVRGDSLEVDPETGKARLIVQIEEGPRYRLAEFRINGNSRFPTEALRRYFERGTGGLLNRFGLGGSRERESGEVFDQSAFDKATEQVSQLYRNYGYLGAQVHPVVQRTTNEAGEPAVRLSWEIREGEPAYINRVSIAGNTFTHEDVIRERIFVLPGDVYNEEMLIQSYQAISGLGFFETPLPMPRMEVAENGKDVDITFDVKEKQTGSVNFGTSLGGYGGLSGFLGYDQPNLFGQAKSGHLRWEYGRYSNNFEASYSDPAISGSRVSGSLSLFSTKNSYGRMFRLEEGEQRRTGAGLRFGIPFPLDPRFTRVFAGYTVARTQYNEDAGVEGSVFGLPDGLQSTFSLGIARNRLNSPLFPTNGSRQELEASFSGGILGGDGNFQKYTASGSWWVPVGQLGGSQPGSRPIRFALGLSADAGAIFGDISRFPLERYTLGGVQYGKPLRGYDETTITPGGFFPQRTEGVTTLDRLGNAYLRLSAEYAMRLNDNISVSLFYDAGNIWRDVSQIDPTRLYRGAGVGLTLVTPFGPLGLDYAYGFDKDKPGWQFHFKFGQGF